MSSLFHTILANLFLSAELFTEEADKYFAIAQDNENMPPQVKEQQLSKGRDMAHVGCTLAMACYFIDSLEKTEKIDDLSLYDAMKMPEQDSVIAAAVTDFNDNEKFVFQDVIQKTILNVRMQYDEHGDKSTEADIARKDLYDSFTHANQLITLIYRDLSSEEIHHHENAAFFMTEYSIICNGYEYRNDPIHKKLFNEQQAFLKNYLYTNDFAMEPGDPGYPQNPFALKILKELTEDKKNADLMRANLKAQVQQNMASGADYDWAKSLYGHGVYIEVPLKPDQFN